MITFFFLSLFGTILVGFLLYHFVFSDDGRKGKAGPGAASTVAHERKDRASGVD